MTQVGEGITGWVAQHGQPYYSPNTADDAIAVPIAGTPDVDESLLVVPLRHGDRVVGTIALSKLGIDQFDQDDMRLLEVLASHAAVALENARLLQMERESAEISGALLELSEVMTRARSTEAVLDDALAAIPPLLHCEEVQAWVRDDATGDFRMARSRGMPQDVRDRLRALVIPGWVGSQLLASAEAPFVVPVDVMEGLPREFPISERSRPVLCAPLRWEPDGLAIIAVVAGDADRTFSQRDLRLAGGLADIASLALGNAGRFTELERAYVSTIEALANALEAKDEYTGDHARALAEMAMAVGTELGLSGDRLKMLELAALFHDIGKIGVPSEIIRKPGPLTAGERTIVRRHPEIGEQILAPVPFLQPIRRMVRACHERWDGKGYPDGLLGDGIPLEARIVFVCDAYHAMTTDRPYRSALPPGEAVRRLRRAAGKQFDPHVVEAFVGLHARGGIHQH
ncbi:MAG TPA: HD domain-containing phosphohydrolase [Actinomycetota bacterium]|nr:HD domain-containing phosphohydrolase [Actinomycetota bacterium]